VESGTGSPNRNQANAVSSKLFVRFYYFDGEERGPFMHKSLHLDNRINTGEHSTAVLQDSPPVAKTGIDLKV
jgi:hypothetical protein